MWNRKLSYLAWQCTKLALVSTLFLWSGSASAQPTPEIFENGATNAASFRPPDLPGGHVAPGSIVAIFGRNLHSGDPVSASELPLPTRMGPLGTRVLVNGTMECPLFFVSEGQINCQLPHDIMGDQVRLSVIHSAGGSNEITVPLRRMGFGTFTMNQNGRGPLVVSNVTDDPDPAQRFQGHGPQSPARPGQFVVLCGSDLGPTDPPVPAGEAASGPAPALRQPRVFMGDLPATIQYAGRAPGFAGLDQMNVMVPEDVPFGCAVPVAGSDLLVASCHR